MLIYKMNNAKVIADELLNNKAAIIETDTVMGVISKNADLIYKIKKRSLNKRVILFVSNFSSIKNLTKKEKIVLKKYWPGALTIIKDGIGYRMPNHKLLNNILKLTGTIYCSSANISGNEPVKNTKGAIKIFGNKKDLFYVEGKELGGMPSTIIDFDNKAVIRQGSIKANTIIKML